jgi:hypothetical protein
MLAGKLGDVDSARPEEAYDTASRAVSPAGSLAGSLQDGFNLALAAGRLLEMTAGTDPAQLRAARTFATQVFGLTLEQGPRAY